MQAHAAREGTRQITRFPSLCRPRNLHRTAQPVGIRWPVAALTDRVCTKTVTIEMPCSNSGRARC